MDLNLLYGILIALIPMFFACILAHRNNFLHGIITYLCFSFILVYCIDKFGSYLPAQIITNFNNVSAGARIVNDFLLNLLKMVPKLGDLLAGSAGEYIGLGFFALVYIISQIISSCIASAKRRRINRYKRAANRY